MKRFKELFLTSNKAIVYDLVSNQLLYYGSLTFLLYGYLYIVRGLTADKPAKPFGQGLQEIGWSVAKARVGYAIVNVLLEYWISYSGVLDSKGKLQISTGTKRMLLFKDMVMTVAWFHYSLGRFY